MIREEEDDMTQEIRRLVLFEVKGELEKEIIKIQAAKIPVKDEWTDGFNIGLDLATRILRKNKNAI